MLGKLAALANHSMSCVHFEGPLLLSSRGVVGGTRAHTFSKET